MTSHHQQLRELSNICAVYSITGVLFMLWVWLLITHQPFFVGGIMHDVDTYRSSAFGAMWAFMATFSASIAYLYYDANRHELDAQIVEHLGSSSGGANPLLLRRNHSRLRTSSHDSGSDSGSYRGSEDEAEGIVRPSPWGGCVRQRNTCFPDRDMS
mmetsp:Transcript_22089/g.48124  ORF Transcript_22089/g.48124 Transcript_22089/m.48124 type:complete len:156 (+) Transcript_22089:429-896(+)